MSTTIFLIRHGTTGITAREQEAEDPLSEEGRQEVTALAARLKEVPIAAFYSSPYRRAIESAEILAAGKNVTVDSYLRELPLWGGISDLVEDRRRLELTDILVEAQEGVRSVLERVVEEHPEETVALVCHGNIIRATLALTLRLSLESVVRLETDNASLTILEKLADGYHLRLFNG